MCNIINNLKFVFKIDGIDQFEIPKGKFDNENSESADLLNNKEDTTIKIIMWEDVLEPKLIENNE